MRLSFGHRTHTGNVRATNQDAFGFDFLDPRGNAALLIVADGMGGYEGGEIASQLAVSTVRSRLVPRAADLAESGAFIGGLMDAIGQANRAIMAAQQENGNHRHMGTTLTAALIWGDRIYLGHIGDSAAFLIRGQDVVQLTADHSVAGELVQSGHLTEEEAQLHPQRHILTRVLGSEEHPGVQGLDETWKVGDVLLICSDGLTNLVRPPELVEAIGTHGFPAAVDELVNLALERGGHDNITVLAARREG